MNDAVKVIGGVVGGLIVIGMFGALIAPDSDTNETSQAKATTPVVQETPSYEYTEEPVIEEPELTEAQEFIACVNSSGLDTEKSAVKHVTKVTGTGGLDDFLSSMSTPEIWTDLDGDMFSSNGDLANVIGSAFISCYEHQSEDTMVTIYNKSGDLLELKTF